MPKSNNNIPNLELDLDPTLVSELKDKAQDLALDELTNVDDQQPQVLPYSRGRRLKKAGSKIKDAEFQGKVPPSVVKKKRSWLFKLAISLFWGVLGLVIAGLSAIFLCYAYFSQNLPTIDSLITYQPKTVTYFYSQDGRVIGEYSHERRLIRPLDAIPELVKQAFIATEDATFYQHGGVNPVAMVRAAYNTIFLDRLQGASTITQQLARSMLLSNERRLERKIREIILAFRIESALA